MDLGYSGRAAVVTGGTSGIGFAVAKLLLAEGAKVAVCGRDDDRLTAARAGVQSLLKSLAGEFAPRIRVNSIVLGLVDSGSAGSMRGRTNRGTGNPGTRHRLGVREFHSTGWGSRRRPHAPFCSWVRRRRVISPAPVSKFRAACPGISDDGRNDH